MIRSLPLPVLSFLLKNIADRAVFLIDKKDKITNSKVLRVKIYQFLSLFLCIIIKKRTL